MKKLLKKNMSLGVDLKLQVPPLMFKINAHNKSDVSSQVVILTEGLERLIMVCMNQQPKCLKKEKEKKKNCCPCTNHLQRLQKVIVMLYCLSLHVNISLIYTRLLCLPHKEKEKKKDGLRSHDKIDSTFSKTVVS